MRKLLFTVAMGVAALPGCASDDTSSGAVCGDGLCEGSETAQSCSADCSTTTTPYCGDRVCNGSETTATCPGDCPSGGPFCGDHSCNGSETNATCPGDCPTAACTTDPTSCSGETICLQGSCVAAYGRSYNIVAYSATIPQFKPDSSTWDASGGAPDPLCKVTLNGQVLYMTSTKDNTFTPTWNEGLPTVIAAGSTLVVNVEDEDVTTNDPMFMCTFQLTADMLHVGQATCSGTPGSLTMHFLTN